MFQLTNVTKIYKTKGDKVKALSNINLVLPTKGLVFVNGKSGSGKSTLLNLLGGLDRATSGTIKYNNIELTSLSEGELTKYRNEYIGFVFQDFCLIENVSVYENVKFALDILGDKSRDYSIIDKVLKRLNIENLSSRKAKELSAGQKQRVSIARALVKHPKVLLCDEPTGNLDSDTSQLILNVLKEVSNDMLVLIISHNYIESYKYASRIIRLDEGKIIEDKSTKFGSSSIVKANDVLYINDINFLTDYDNYLIDDNITKGRVRHIRPFKNLFSQTTTIYTDPELLC